ncbi:hypothetical protein LJR221_001438 [Agrobacterium tumefaciens]
MRQSFSVTTPASNLSLLTIEQLRAAAGLADGDASRDEELNALGQSISTDIAVACNVADDGINPPTLLKETVSETFWVCHRPDELILSRRFISSIASVSEAGSVLAADAYFLDRGAGLLNRANSGRPWTWATGQLVISYDAGFATVPADLVAAATDLVRIRLSSSSRDPLVKSESIEVPDVQSRKLDFWVGALPGASGPVPAEILTRLSRYKNVVIA